MDVILADQFLFIWKLMFLFYSVNDCFFSLMVLVFVNDICKSDRQSRGKGVAHAPNSRSLSGMKIVNFHMIYCETGILLQPC